MAAALRFVVERGHAALTLRAVAEAVGVAHRSLYNHFADRDAILDAVAEEGFRRLAVELAGATDADAYVQTYVAFALASPGLYDLMRSRPHGTMKEKPFLQRSVHLGIAEAMRLFGRSGAAAQDNRRAIMKVLILLNGGIELYSAGILDVEGEEGLVRELQAMVRPDAA